MLLYEFSEWLKGHQDEAVRNGFELDMVILPADAEAAMVTAAVTDNPPKEVFSIMDQADNSVRCRLNGVLVKFSERVKPKAPWFRYTSVRNKVKKATNV